MKNTLLIENRTAADFLTRDQRRWLAPFFNQALSMSEATHYLDVPLNTLHYRVQKMLDLGLLEVAREEVVSGHLTKFYRTTSEAFIVPFEATSNVDLVSYARGLGCNEVVARGWAHGLRQQSLEWAFRIGFMPGIGVGQQLVGKDAAGVFKSPTALPGGTPYCVMDAELRLDSATAEALQNDLQGLYEKYLGRQKAEGTPRWLALAFVPRVDFSQTCRFNQTPQKVISVRSS